MQKIMDIIEKKTFGHSYHTMKYSYDTVGVPGVDYDDKIMVWEKIAETRQPKARFIDLRDEMEDRKGEQPIITYFLDGSRHVYKVDDMSYNKQLYPIVAGQIGVGCCRRLNGRMKLEKFEKKYVIVLPDVANPDSAVKNRTFFAARARELNDLDCVKRLESRFGVKIAFEVKTYSKETSKTGNLESSGIQAIQDYMLEVEKSMVAVLVKEGKLNGNNYLLKDGSLEYREDKASKDNPWALQKLKSNYKWVIGVSKKFNPESIRNYAGRPDSDYIANLPLFHRTQVALYKHNEILFGVWYVRIRDKRCTQTPFDGVLKVEQIILDDDNRKLDTDIVNMLSVNLINERVPTCYGSDTRWANHLYPVFLTESFVKSRYVSSETFMQLF